MTTRPGAPTFADAAENGPFRFYALHEKKDLFEAMQDKMATEFLPQDVAPHYRKHVAHENLDHLCHLGMFEANPIEIVVATAFIMEAVKAFRIEYPVSDARYPESKPYWDAQNKMVNKLCDKLADALGADSMAVNHKVYHTVLYIIEKL